MPIPITGLFEPSDGAHGFDLLDVQDLQGTLTVGQGGTGATTAAGARTNLSAAAATHTHALAEVTDVTASATEVNYTDGVTSAIQTQLDAKQASDADLTALAGIAASEGFYRKTDAGTATVHKSNLAAAVAPGATDDSAAGYSIGSLWIDTTADKSYVCVDATATAAVWNDLTAVGAGGDSITVNAAAVVDADFDDATPAAPANAQNVKWQKDASSPANISAYIDKGVANSLATLDAGTKVPAAQIQEVLALADLSDVTAKTGTGTVVAMSVGPTFTGVATFDGELLIPLIADPGAPFNGEVWQNVDDLKYKSAGGVRVLAYKAHKLSVFAATSSAELAGVISDETGSGALVFATSPTLVTPALGTPASGTLTNCSGYPLEQKYRVRTFTYIVQTPTTADDYETKPIPFAGTMLKVFYWTDAGTVDFNVEKRALATPGSAGTNIWTADKQASGTVANSATFDSGAIAAESFLYVDISAVSGAGWLKIMGWYTID